MRQSLVVEKPFCASAPDHFGPLLGRSPVMRVLFAHLANVAPSDSAVLIVGETGTGKELVARAIHEASPRARQPFVVVDCAALPENLLEAELFGHAKGAFTGADSLRAGAIETAAGGTVFLDEIGELPMAMQPKLLRVLEARTVRRIGEAAHRPVDVRFVSATHRDLSEMVAAGAFREDLYFRLTVLPVVVPPLRERTEDIELLMSSFWPDAMRFVDDDALAAIAARPWRGNVRELRNFVDRARAFGVLEALASFRDPKPRASTPLELPSFDQTFRAFRDAWREAGDREFIRQLLARHDQNVGQAAQSAEIDRTYLYKLIRRYLR